MEQQQLGPYLLLEELGRGGGGVVYRARHQRLDREVALKVLCGPGGAQTMGLLRFIAEARLSAALEHPNLVPALDLGEARGVHYLAMPLLSGGSLRDRLAAGPLDVDDALRIAEEVARGLYHAHSHAILHRDVKPENVLFDAEGAARVADFGLARDTSAPGLTASGTVLGTPAYMSPEQANGELDRVDRRSDVYGLGAVLFEMLAGRPPHGQGKPLEVLRRVLDQAPPRLERLRPDVPPAVAAVVARALARSPEDRYPSALDLAEDCARARRGEPTLARPAGRVARTLAAPAVRRALAGSGVAVVALLSFAAGRRSSSPAETPSPVGPTSSAAAAPRAATAAPPAQPGAAVESAAGPGRDAEALAVALELIERGRAARRAGDLDAAAADARLAVRLAPEGARPHLFLGVCLHDQGELEDALVALDRALALDPELPEAHMARGAVLLLLSRDLRACLGAFDRAVALGMRGYEVFRNRALARLRGDDLEGAAADLEQAAAFTGGLPARVADVTAALTEVRLLLLAPAADRGVLREALAARPVDPARAHELLSRLVGQPWAPLLLLEYRGCAALELGRLEAALRDFERCVQRAPIRPDAHYNLACVLARLGRTEPALAALEQAVALGFSELGLLEHDADLESLRADPRFAALVRRARGS